MNEKRIEGEREQGKEGERLDRRRGGMPQSNEVGTSTPLKCMTHMRGRARTGQHG